MDLLLNLFVFKFLDTIRRFSELSNIAKSVRREKRHDLKLLNLYKANRFYLFSVKAKTVEPSEKCKCHKTQG